MPKDRLNRLKSRQFFQEDLAVADGEVLAFNKGIAQITGEQGMLEVEYGCPGLEKTAQYRDHLDAKRGPAGSGRGERYERKALDEESGFYGINRQIPAT